MLATTQIFMIGAPLRRERVRVRVRVRVS